MPRPSPSLLATTLILGAALAATTAKAQEVYQIDTRHTFPAYEVTHLGLTIQRGIFGKVTGKVTLDRTARTGSAEVVIDMASVYTPVPRLVEILRSEEYFDVEKHPTATFRSKDFRFEGERLVAVNGELTMRGITRPVALAVATFKCGVHPANKKPICGADATTTIRRSEFGMTRNAASVGDDVKLLIPIEALQD